MSSGRAGRQGLGMELSIGCRFGTHLRYELAEPLGIGGSAVVHRVHDRHRGLTLAGKFALATEDDLGDSALAHEGAMLARLRHESIISLVDRGCDANTPYLLLEYAPGETLTTRLARSRPPALHATRILIDVTAGLAHAHQRGVLHLDIKPSNVIVLPSGRAKLIDFGAGSMSVGSSPCADAEPVSQSYRRAVPNEAPYAFVKGTLHYMAPEQWSLAPCQPRTDLWGAGMLYYELLTGQLPFGSQPTCLRMRSSQGQSVPFSPSACGVPPAVEDIFARTLAPDPCDRFSDAASLLDALTHVAARLASAVS